LNSYVKFAYVVAQDIDRLRDFYVAALGMPIHFQDGSRWCQLDGGRVDLALSSEEEAQPCPGGTVVVYQVESLDEGRDRVTAAGGRVLHRRGMGAHGDVMTCLDVEGNHFQLFASQPKDPT
jgi:predicted enzyme related to lactoylglutathione lyase